MANLQKENLSQLLAEHARTAQADIERWLTPPGTPQTLADAMRYCVLGGGKRLRPALVRMSHAALGGVAGDELARRAAVAIELIHCYSLVHDDLPAMDNDTLRRGLPTAHVKFGEAMAILAGDALLTRAFGVIAEGLPMAAGRESQVARLVADLAAGAGECGMIAGQVADMDLCHVPDGLAGLEYIHGRKTAALIRTAVRMGGLCAGASAGLLAALTEFGEQIGLAFQLVDDLLDVTGEAAVLGKTPGKDAQSGKRTHLSHMGIEEAWTLAEAMTARAISALSPLGDAAGDLASLAKLLTHRNH